jgi:hypothetical protein
VSCVDCRYSREDCAECRAEQAGARLEERRHAALCDIVEALVASGCPDAATALNRIAAEIEYEFARSRLLRSVDG